MKQAKEAIFGALLGAVVAGSGSWLAFGQDKVTRDEMRSEVQSVAVQLDRLAEAHVQLLLEVRLTSQKVDRLLKTAKEE